MYYHEVPTPAMPLIKYPRSRIKEIGWADNGSSTIQLGTEAGEPQPR